MRYRLEGNWTKGLAFDLHTLASTYLGDDALGHPQFDNTRSEMGELVYRLKSRGDKAVVEQITSLLDPIRGIETFDAIIPVPASKPRAIQHVDIIAEALGKRRGVRVLKGHLIKTGRATELKGVDNPQERAKILEKSILVSGRDDISGQKVLLLDDIYRSGATLNACCAVLKEQAGVGEVSVLTMTKTRSKR